MSTMRATFAPRRPTTSSGRSRRAAGFGIGTDRVPDTWDREVIGRMLWPPVEKPLRAVRRQQATGRALGWEAAYVVDAVDSRFAVTMSFG